MKKVIVISANKKDQENHYNFFKSISQNNIKDFELFDNPKLIYANYQIEFLLKDPSPLGLNAYYVIDLTKDADFHENIALAMIRQ